MVLPDSNNLTDSELLAQAIRVVNTHFLGMLTTVDAQGAPHSRWMGSATLVGGLQKVYTLSARQARKVEHVRANPNVCWVFSAADFSTVVTLLGTAHVLESPVAVQPIWDRLVDAARAYAMPAMNDDENLEFVAIETDVKRVEFISPRYKIYQPRMVELAEVV